MDLIKASKRLVPGFRFHPTDEELFMFYLKRKVMGKPCRHQIMAEVDVYTFAPWDLPSMSCLKTGDLNWYFFCPRAKKYACGSRTNRANKFGYWKSTGNDRLVQYQGRQVGKIKTLIFHRGKPPSGDRTDWVIYEYRLEDQLLVHQGVSQDSYVICKIFQKSGLGPKNGEHYAAPFVEEEWESDDDNVETNQGPVLHHESVLPTDCTVLTTSEPVSLAPSSVEQPDPIIETEDELDTLLSMFTADDAPTGDMVGAGTMQELDGDFFDGLEDLGDMPHCPSGDYNWSEMLAVVGHAGEFIEMDDLLK